MMTLIYDCRLIFILFFLILPVLIKLAVSQALTTYPLPQGPLSSGLPVFRIHPTVRNLRFVLGVSTSVLKDRGSVHLSGFQIKSHLQDHHWNVISISLECQYTCLQNVFRYYQQPSIYVWYCADALRTGMVLSKYFI